MKRRSNLKRASLPLASLAVAVLVTTSSGAQLTREQVAAMRARAEESDKYLLEITEKMKAATAALAAKRLAVTGVDAERPAEALKRPVTKHAAYYSMQLKNPLPMPFNPFPELSVYEIGDGRFMYDDCEVDYTKLRAKAQTMAAASAFGSEQMAGPMSATATGALSLGMTFNAANGFLLDVFNMTPGQLYGIGAKNSVDADPFNTWTLVSVFEAQAPNEELQGNASAPTRLYVAIDLGSYVGPSVSIASPVSGSTVSGDVPLQVRVSDILPLLSVKVYVGGIQVGMISPGQNGIVNLPTRWFPNGQHEIRVGVVNEGLPVDTDGDLVADGISTFEGWATLTLNFTNEVCMQNYSPLYSKAGFLTLQYSATCPQDYTFEVFKTNGTLLHSASGQSDNGNINPEWNYTDLLGSPMNDASYVFSLTYEPTGGPAALAAKKIFTTNVVDNGVKVGKYVVSYGEWRSEDLNSGLANLNAGLSARVNSASYFNDDIIGSGREDYNPVYADFTSDAFPIRQATQTNDLLALTNALKNAVTGSWLFDGHSRQNNLIHDGHPTNPYLTVDLTSKQVAALLGNSYEIDPGTGFLMKYGRRLFSTMITGCFAAASGTEYPDATGTPPGVDQTANSQIRKTVFLGFSQLSYSGPTKFNWILRIHSDWLDGGDYDTDINSSVWRANLAYPEVQTWGPTVFGYGFLEYNANQSR